MSGKIKPLKTGQGELIKSIDDQITDLVKMCDEIKGEIARYWGICQQETGGIIRSEEHTSELQSQR